VDGRLHRLGRLDLDRAVAHEPGRGPDQLADDQVLLEAEPNRSALQWRPKAISIFGRMLK
jgi:hypothetical protein